MAVRRIAANFAAADPGKIRRFYQSRALRPCGRDGHGLDRDTRVRGFGEPADQLRKRRRVEHASAGHLHIEVDDVDEIHGRTLKAKAEIVYPPTYEPWGVRRSYVRDPLGRIVAVLAHRE